MLVQEGSQRIHWQGEGYTALQCLEEEDGGSSSGGHQSQEGAGLTRCEAAYAYDVHAACFASYSLPFDMHVFTGGNAESKY